MGTRRRFCSCRLWRLQQPCDERLRFDEASRRRRRRINARHPEFFAGFVGSRASMTPPLASGAFIEVQPLVARLLKPPEAAITETTPSAHSLDSAAPGCCIEKGKLNHRQRHTKKVLVQRSSGYIAIMSLSVKPPSHTRGAVSTPKDCALTLRSSRRVPAGRFRPAFHSGPYAPCLHARLNSNVRRHKSAPALGEQP